METICTSARGNRPPTQLSRGQVLPFLCWLFWRGYCIPPVGPWMLVGGGGMSFMTILISSTSMLTQRSHFEHHSLYPGRYTPRKGTSNDRSEYPGRRYRFKEVAFQCAKGSYHPAIRLFSRYCEGGLVLSAGFAVLCAHVSCDVSC